MSPLRRFARFIGFGCGMAKCLLPRLRFTTTEKLKSSRCDCASLVETATDRSNFFQWNITEFDLRNQEKPKNAKVSSLPMPRFLRSTAACSLTNGILFLLHESFSVTAAAHG